MNGDGTARNGNGIQLRVESRAAVHLKLYVCLTVRRAVEDGKSEREQCAAFGVVLCGEAVIPQQDIRHGG